MSESSLFVFTSSRSPNLHDTLGEPDEINVNIFFLQALIPSPPWMPPWAAAHIAHKRNYPAQDQPNLLLQNMSTLGQDGKCAI